MRERLRKIEDKINVQLEEKKQTMNTRESNADLQHVDNLFTPNAISYNEQIQVENYKRNHEKLRDKIERNKQSYNLYKAIFDKNYQPNKES